MRLVIFDFDGVIADSWQIAFATSKYFNPDLTEERYRGWFEGNINNRLVEEPDEVKRAARRKSEGEFFARYSPLLMERPLFDHIDDAIRALAEQYTLVIVSSTVSDVIDAFLRKHGIRDCFQEILGNDIDRSKWVKIEKALRAHHVIPADAVMITDTLGDIREAKHAGVASIAVTWGFHDAERLMKGEPYALVATVAALEGEIEEYFSRG